MQPCLSTLALPLVNQSEPYTMEEGMEDANACEVDRRKPKFATSCLCALLCIAGAASSAKSDDQPHPALKNVSLVSYRLAGPNKGPCVIDWQAWNTAMDFVANQSTKLKLIKDREHYERARELADKISETGRRYFASSTKEADVAKKAWDEAKDNHSKYAFAPKLTFIAETMEHNGGCFGELSATVTATLKSSEMISTGKVIQFPFYEIWGTGKLLSAPPNSFSRFVIETSEQMMKQFVNDWALSQEL
jgi:hypothetical protein